MSGGCRIEAPRVVATVHRRGYRFIAPVITTDPAADVRVEPPAPPTAKLDHREAERRQLTAMVARLTEGKSLPPKVLDQLLAKADGVPLFVEELTKTVLESGLLADVGDRYEVSGPLPPLAVPATLHDSLMARLDRLASVKEVAQIGAVVGREFSYQLLATLSPFDEDGLQEALSRLVGAELMCCRGVAPDATYRFKHALVGDAAYASLLRSKRQELHARIAGEMETWATEATEAEPEILAHHLTEAGLEAKAIVYWHKAGQRAVERCANVEAIAHFEKGLALLDALPESPQRIRQEIELQAAMGVALMTTKGFAAPEVRQAYGRARELCEQVDQVPQLLNILQGLWYFHAVRGELQSGRGLGEQYFAGARRSGDPAHLMVAHHLMGGVLCWSGELGSAEEHYKRGIALSNAREQPVHAPLFGEDLGVLCRTGGCHSLWLLGYPDQALRRSHEGLALARERAHPFMLVLALVYAATLHQFRRQVGATRKFAAAAKALCREQGFSYYLAWATVLDGWALAKSGQFSVGVAQIREGIAAMDATGARLRRPYYLGVLADALGEAGQPEEAVALVNEALAAVKISGERWWEAELHRLKGELLLANPARRDAEAEACLRRATEVARALAARSLELRATTSLARFCAEHGNRRKAHDLLAAVYAWFTESFDTADLKDAKALLDELA